MGARKRQANFHQDHFLEEFGERLERSIEVSRPSWDEFAERRDIDVDRVIEWREGAIRAGGQ